MRILFIVGRELSYQRNEVLLRAFQRVADVDVVGRSTKSRSLILNSLLLSLSAFPRLLFGHYDLIFIGFYGHLLMLPVGVLSRWRKIPILFDVFVSNYDTLVDDRKMIRRRSLVSRLAMWLDRTSCGLADHLLIDTRLHADYFIRTFAIPPEKLSVLPVGCNEDIFPPSVALSFPSEPAPKTKVLYYCTYQPLHGAHIVVQAADLLKDENITFHLIGTGQEYPRAQQLAKDYKLTNLRFTPFVPLMALRDEIRQADICLGGHFGVSDKANRVIPGKIYQLMAMSRPIIAADTAANRALLLDRESALLVPPSDAASLAEAIRTLHENPALRQNLAQNGYKTYQNTCSETIITSQVAEIITQAL